MDNDNLGNLGSAELAALERFRKRKIKLDSELGVTTTVPVAQPNDAPRTLTERETKSVNIKKQMVSLLAIEIKKLFSTGLDDGKLITMDIESDSGKVINPDNLSEEKLEQMSLSELSKIRFRVDVLNQIIVVVQKIRERKTNLFQILEQAGIKTAKSYNLVEQAGDDKEYLELFCYLLCQETSTNLMSLYYACKNYITKFP